MVMEELPRWARRALGDDAALRIARAVAEAESQTSGEIVPLLVRRSSTVGHVPMLSFTLLLLCVLLADLPARLTLLGGPHLAWLAACWLLAAALALLLSRLDAVQRLLTPRIDQQQQVELRAQVEFYALEMSQTEGRTGILLLVSLMEHRAVVLADRAIARQQGAEVWQEVVDLMIHGVKRGDLTQGMLQAIHRCGELLTPHFPIADDDRNELPNRLVVKE